MRWYAGEFSFFFLRQSVQKFIIINYHYLGIHILFTSGFLIHIIMLFIHLQAVHIQFSWHYNDHVIVIDVNFSSVI